MTEFPTVRVAAVQATPVILDADASVEKAVLLPAPVAPAVHVARQWERSDDDILPTRKAKGLRISLPLRRG